jgi:hypothetical protein
VADDEISDEDARAQAMCLGPRWVARCVMMVGGQVRLLTSPLRAGSQSSIRL